VFRRDPARSSGDGRSRRGSEPSRATTLFEVEVEVDEDGVVVAAVAAEVGVAADAGPGKSL
jgi:hypothetical protein